MYYLDVKYYVIIYKYKKLYCNLKLRYIVLYKYAIKSLMLLYNSAKGALPWY